VQPRPSSSSVHHSKPRKADIVLTELPSDSADEVYDDAKKSAARSTASAPPLRSIAVLVCAQALLLPISASLARMMGIPNWGLGAGFSWTTGAAVLGVRWTLPLFAVAGLMRLVEPYSPALQGVTRATQRSVLAVMGKERRPTFALAVSILLGVVAGWGEEWLFRGVFQTMLTERFSSRIGLAVSGVVFGLLHAVTPVYALLAALASFFFGYLYISTGNLAVPMVCHAVYDVGALMWAHWSATALPSKEQDDILESGPLAPIMDAGQLNSSNK
jgi:membrane protease YdiL (CAAX protease family)